MKKRCLSDCSRRLRRRWKGEPHENRGQERSASCLLYSSLEVALTAKVPYDMGPNDCNEGFKALRGENVVCNRPKGHDGKHWRWIWDRVWYFEVGYAEAREITKKPGEKRF